MRPMTSVSAEKLHAISVKKVPFFFSKVYWRFSDLLFFESGVSHPNFR